MAKGPGDPREAVLLGVACIVVVVWAVATLAQVASPDHQVPRGLDVIMPIVATCLFGGAWMSGRKRNSKDDDE